MTDLAVSAIGVDRPGIVAAVTGVLVDRGCNLEDSSMSILRGRFAMMLVVSNPAGITAHDLEMALVAATTGMELRVMVRTIDDEVPGSPAGDSWTVAVYGADQPGMVHRVTQLLADEGVNVVDLTTHVIGEKARPVYAMLVDVTIPAGTDSTLVVDRLQTLAAELGVSCSAHLVEPDIL
jgi:glycine cleavage system transcriptional repressor